MSKFSKSALFHQRAMLMKYFLGERWYCFQGDRLKCLKAFLPFFKQLKEFNCCMVLCQDKYPGDLFWKTNCEAEKLKKVQNFLPHISLSCRGQVWPKYSLCKCPVPALSQFCPLNRPPISLETAWNNTPHFSDLQSRSTNKFIFTICQDYTCQTCFQYKSFFFFRRWHLLLLIRRVLCLKNSPKLASKYFSEA